MGWFTFLAGVATGVLLKQSQTGATSSRQAASAGSHAATHPSATRAAPAGLTNVSDLDAVTYLPARTDEQVRERILSQIGRTITNPESIQVDVSGGCVTLRGQVQARDSVLLMAEVESTAGVVSVRNQLDIQGSLEEIAPPMTRDRPAVRAAERAQSRMS